MRNGLLVVIGICLTTAATVQAQVVVTSPQPVAQDWVVASGGEIIEGQPMMMDEGGRPSWRLWGSLDYLAWWTSSAKTPALLTSGDRASAGILGRPGTNVLFGGNDVDLLDRSGLRLVFGGWLDCDQTLGIEAGYFFLGDRSRSYGVDNPSDVVTARPFFNTATGQQDSQLVSVPGSLQGRAFAAVSNCFDGAEINAVLGLCSECDRRLEGIVGFRYLGLDENLSVEENLRVSATGSANSGTRFGVFDQFSVENRFYGAQVGLRGEIMRGRWSFGGSSKLALGCTDETVTINGSTLIAPVGRTATVSQGGLLALPSNIGTYQRNTFAAVPEFGINIGYQVTSAIRLRAGYTILYWSDVVRAGEQIDTNINPLQLPVSGGTSSTGSNSRPQFHFRDSDFFAHGINLGVEVRY